MILEKQFYSKNSLLRSTFILLRGLGTMGLRLLFTLLGKKIRHSVFRSERKRLKGLPYLLINREKQLACISCGLCQDICPSNCLHILIEGRPEEAYGNPPEGVTLEVLKCMFCGLCEEVCPEDAIRMGPETVLSGHAEQEWVWDHHFLAFRPSLNGGRGVLSKTPWP